jgi:predicted nucleic acid-binding protein
MGLIVLDAGILIAALDSSDGHHASAIAALRETRGSGDALVVPASAYAEVLVGPSRRGADAVATVDALLDALPAVVEPVSRDVARAAAALRARHGRALRLPDALVIATAAVVGADQVLTTDARWPEAGAAVKVVGAGR